MQSELSEAERQGRVSAYLQPDALVLPCLGRPFLCEAKSQEAFQSPPFDGHGLPVWQATRYEQVRLATRLRTLLVVYDDHVRYSAWLDELEQGDHFDTAGTVKWPRRIYPLASFERRAAA